MLTAIIHGVVLSFGLIMALGAQNIFIFNQGASHKEFRHTLPAIITASICDTILIILAVLGISLIVMTVPILQIILFSVGLLFLIYIGWSIWASDPAKINNAQKAMSPKKQILFAMSVSLLNPHAVLDTVGVIGTSSLRYEENPELIAFTISCIAISWIAFIALSIIGRFVRTIDKEGKIVVMINKTSAIIIWGVAAFLGFQLYNLFLG